MGQQWFGKQLDALRETGIDGFKFDAGDSMYYREDNVTYGNTTLDEQSKLWADFGSASSGDYRAFLWMPGYDRRWRILNRENYSAVLKSIELREKYVPYLMEEIRKTSQTGEPVVRYMAYDFPEKPVERITDQVMLGSRYLIAPVYEKGKEGRNVYLPQGSWIWDQKEIVSRGETMYFKSVPGIPNIFERSIEES